MYVCLSGCISVSHKSVAYVSVNIITWEGPPLCMFVCIGYMCVVAISSCVCIS